MFHFCLLQFASLPKYVRVLFAALAFFICLNAARAQTSDALPTLRGDEAIEKLKQSGQYDSLIEAVKAARKEQPDDPPAEDAVGQTAKLVASDGAANDIFGISVAVSGETAIVGSVSDDVRGNADQGSAYIFVRSGTVWSQQQKLTASDGAAFEQFGFSVAISGETAIVGAFTDDVGANGDQGSAYIFVRSGTVWSEQQKLTASDGTAGDIFGFSVAVSGETAIVGTYFDDVGTNANQGSAYIFVRSGTVWSEQQQLTASDGTAFDNFGNSVAISGETAIVGAFTDDVGANTNQGSAYIFVRSGVMWSEQQKLTASDGAAMDNFGVRVAISGETAIVGAVSDAVGINLGQGSAYVFVRSGTMWSQQQKLIASDGAANDQFGISVGISGDKVVVGARLDDVGANTNQGSAYIFVRSGTTWGEQQKLTASDGAAQDSFGISVAISGNNMIVGASEDDVGANFNQGSAYTFRVLSGAWNQEAKKVSSDGAAFDEFGNSVAISGETAIVGAFTDDVGANFNQGSAYIFVRSGTVWSQQQKLTASDGAAFDEFGLSVGISGETAIVGARLDDVGANGSQGSAYIFIRSGTVWSQQQKLTASDGATFDQFGGSVAVSGETAVVGAHLGDVGANANQGSAYVFVRSGTMWSEQQKLTASDGATFDQFGISVGISGDTAIVGAYADDVGANGDQGSAYIFVRSGTVWSEQQRLTASDGAANDIFGLSVGISGETAIVGARLDDVGANTNQGSAYIFVRSGGVWSEQQRLTASDGAAFDLFGFSVAISGETAIVGAHAHTVGANSEQGSAYIFERAGTTWTQITKLVDGSGAAGDQFGFSVGISGDKVVVGAPFSDASVSTPPAGGDFVPAAADQGAALFFVNAPFQPTAATVSISGRVVTPQNLGLTNALVTLTDTRGDSRTILTGKRGIFRFADVAAGETYIISVSARRYTFAPQVFTVNEDLTDIIFTALQ